MQQPSAARMAPDSEESTAAQATAPAAGEYVTGSEGAKFAAERIR
jgi:hypothetical protein